MSDLFEGYGDLLGMCSSSHSDDPAQIEILWGHAVSVLLE